MVPDAASAPLPTAIVTWRRWACSGRTEGAISTRTTSKGAAAAAELRGFMARGQPIPLSYALDASDVASGSKAAVDGNDSIRFGCTGCGACCRSFADTVVLDPHDMWLMAGGGARLSWHAILPRVRLVEGLWSRDALPAHLPNPAGASPGDRPGRCPLLYLRSRAVSPRQVQTRAASPPPPSSSALHTHPTPSYTVLDRPHIMAHDGDRQCMFAAADPHGRRVAGGRGPGVTCTLGPHAMPYACALYPLGELWISPPAAPTPPGTPTPLTASAVRVPLSSLASVAARATGQEGRHTVWTVDGQCEGVGQPDDAGGSAMTIDQYGTAPQRRLPHRQTAALWHRLVATHLATHQLQERVVAAVTTMVKQRWWGVLPADGDADVAWLTALQGWGMGVGLDVDRWMALQQVADRLLQHRAWLAREEEDDGWARAPAPQCAELAGAGNGLMAAPPPTALWASAPAAAGGLVSLAMIAAMYGPIMTVTPPTSPACGEGERAWSSHVQPAIVDAVTTLTHSLTTAVRHAEAAVLANGTASDQQGPAGPEKRAAGRHRLTRHRMANPWHAPAWRHHRGAITAMLHDIIAMTAVMWPHCPT